MACSAGNALPGPAYEAQHRQLAPSIKHATQRRDFATCKALYGQLFAKHIELCPSSYSPRIIDPTYRERFLDYYTDLMTLRDFDDRIAAWTTVMNQRIVELRQSQMANAGVVSFGIFAVAVMGQPQQPQFPDQPFWAVYQAFRGELSMSTQVASESGALAKYPDIVTPELIERIGISAFVQGWLPYISQACQSHLIRDAKLVDQYIDTEPPPLLLRRCGGCGGRLDCVSGAKCVVCFGCGRRVDVSSHEFSCPECGAPSSIPEGASQHSCPYCGLRAQGVGPPR